MDTLTSNAPELVDSILRQIGMRTDRRIRELVIEIGHECVTLSGRARSYHVKQLAQDEVRKLLPELRLKNAIVVE